MPLQQEYDFIQMYAARSGLMKGPNQDRSPPDTASERPGGQPAMLANMTDSLQRQIRISGFVRDIGSNRMPKLLARIRADIDSLFPARFIGEEVNDSLRVVNNPELLEQAGDESPAATAGDPAQQGAQASAAGAPDKAEAEDEAYVEALITGTTRIFIKANEYLLNNLGWALVAAFTIIGLQMFALFASWRIMWISMIPNLIPLGMTAAIMGFAGIPLKPSTALIYEMAFGIAIDNSIHYLAMYRQHRKNGCGVDEAVRRSLRVTGMSIIYTSVVLFMGFIIFVPSAFGSTSSMGTLTAITLFIATFSNLLLMPALLVNFDRRDRVIDKALIDEE
jgi:predicted RND superfamily exporter protein